VFNNVGFPKCIVEDIKVMLEMNDVNPYRSNNNYLVKKTNNLDRDPPMNGIVGTSGVIVLINSGELLEEVYVKQNQYFTKDLLCEKLEPC
jgi:hypothetical protein